MIVEGRTEVEAFRRLQRRVPGCPLLDLAAVSRCNLKGVGGDAPADVIAGKIAKLALLIAPDNDKIVVCIDREGRPDTAALFAQDVSDATQRRLASLGSPLPVPLEVVVADRAFEASILADIQGVCRQKRVALPRNRCYEGYLGERGDVGARLLRRFLHQYDKVADGASLFDLVDLTRARVCCRSGRGWGSASLNSFLVALGL